MIIVVDYYLGSEHRTVVVEGTLYFYNLYSYIFISLYLGIITFNHQNYITNLNNPNNHLGSEQRTVVVEGTGEQEELPGSGDRQPRQR